MGDIGAISILSAHAVNHKQGGNDSIRLDELATPIDNTVLNSTTGRHGLLPKLSNNANQYLNGVGAFATIPIGSVPAHASTHILGGSDQIKLDDLLTPDDNTDLNTTTARHGLAPKLGGGTTDFLRADGTWAVPPSSGSPPSATTTVEGIVELAVDGENAADVVVQGNDSRLSNSRTPIAHATSHKTGGSDAIKLDELAATTDITTLNSSITAHGLLPKLSNVGTQFLSGLGTWLVPAGGGGGGGAPDISKVIYVAADGSGDYTTFASAISSEGANCEYVLAPGDHAITAQLVSTLSNVWIHGAGVGTTRIVISNGVGTTNAGLVFKGSTGTQRLLTVNAPRESHTLTFASGHGFAAGDWLILRRNVQIQSNGNSGQDAEIHKVKSVTSTVVTLEDYIYADYNTGSPMSSAAYEITWAANLTISDLTITDSRTPANQSAVTEGGDATFLFCYNLKLINILFDRMFYCGAAIQNCYNVDTYNVGYESTQFLAGATYWVNYGIDILNASTNVTINGGWANRCRHSVTTDVIGGLTFTYGRQRNITINGMKSYNANLSHFDSHEGAVGVTLNGCVAIGGYHQLDSDYTYGGAHSQQTDQVKGFTARSPTTWNGCIALECEQGGFEVAGDDPYAVGTDEVPGGDGSAMIGCQVIATQGGDGIGGSTDIRRAVRINTHRKGIRIIGCLFKNIGGIVIRLHEDTGLGGHTPPSNIIIKGNTFMSCGADLSSTYGLIWGDSGGNDLIITGNDFAVGTPASAAYPVKFVGTVNRMVFKDNDVDGMTNTMPQFAAGSTGIVIHDNPGLNPIGNVTNPVNTTNPSIGSYGGTTATVSASTYYNIVGGTMICFVTGGTGVSAIVRDDKFNTMESGLTTPFTRTLPRGYQINFGAFSVAPTLKVGAY